MLTKEQEAIVNATDTNELVKVEAVAGSGKTHTMVSVSKHLEPEKALYLAYNKAIALEAKHKFPYYVDCRTVHSLAHMYVVTPQNRTIEPLTPSCIEEAIPYADKLLIIAVINEFCLSDSVDLSWFNKQLGQPHAEIAKKYIKKMQDNEIPVTFSFMLKYFHLQLLFGTINPAKVDLLMLDEGGDTSGVIVEIFRLYPAKRKIMCGDPHQNIYMFAHTVNGFESLKDEGIQLPMTKSFRITPRIAKDVEAFCQKWLSKSMKFEGTEQPNQEIKTKAYIARTNAGIVARIIKLNETGIKYSLTREPKEIFSLILTLMTLKEDSIVYDKRYTYLPRELVKYNDSPLLQSQYNSFRGYLYATYAQDDIQLKSAINLIIKYGYKELWKAYDIAKNMPKREPITVTTAHSSKGLEFDEVYIEDDLNKGCELAKMARFNTDEIITELRLYYVACTRCRLSLLNAKELIDDRID